MQEQKIKLKLDSAAVYPQTSKSAIYTEDGSSIFKIFTEAEGKQVIDDLKATGVLITDDNSLAQTIKEILGELSTELPGPIYSVLNLKEYINSRSYTTSDPVWHDSSENSSSLVLTLGTLVEKLQSYQQQIYDSSYKGTEAKLLLDTNTFVIETSTGENFNDLTVNKDELSSLTKKVDIHLQLAIKKTLLTYETVHSTPVGGSN